MKPIMRKIAEGWTSELFLQPDGHLLKLHKGQFALRCAAEFQKMRVLREYLSCVPEVFELVEVDGRPGYTMAYIDGRTLGYDETITPALVVDTLCTVAKKLCAVPLSVIDESIRERAIKWIKDRGSPVEGAAGMALELLSQVPEDRGLCHGDFHPGNILISDNDTYVIDWNGAGSASLECDVAKSVVVMAFSPTGLAFKGTLHAACRDIAKECVAKLIREGMIDPDLLARWLFIRATEFSSLPIPYIPEQLLPVISRCVAEKSVDYRIFFWP